MLEYYVITHLTQDGDTIYYNEQHNIFLNTIDKATWYENKVDALLVCRKHLKEYINISIIKIN